MAEFLLPSFCILVSANWAMEVRDCRLSAPPSPTAAATPAYNIPYTRQGSRSECIVADTFAREAG